MRDADLDYGRRAINRETLTNVFAAVARGDAEAQVSNYTADAVLELPYGDPPLVVAGREQIRRLLERSFRSYRMSLTVTDVHECIDADRLVVEFTSAGSAAGQVAPVTNTYIAVFRFRDGKICRQREFFDPRRRPRTSRRRS